MIPDYILNRIATSDLSAQRIAQLFSDLALSMQQMNIPGAGVNLEYVAPEDVLQDGDLIPIVTFSLRRFKSPQETE